jgi:hypothetical protein
MTEYGKDYWPGWLESLQDEESKCNRCGATIKWGKTKKGKNVPMDPHPNMQGELEAHFATCKGRE